MQEEIHKRLHASKLGPCACSEVRRLARKLSSLCDTLLSPEDLTITKYSLLANIARAGQLSHAVLAEKVGMDRTTLTRNLRRLTRAKWVTARTGQDRRQHLLQLTPARRRRLVRSLPARCRDGSGSSFTRTALWSDGPLSCILSGLLSRELFKLICETNQW
jgi:DNA-binding MarR family transcriptional regulator